VILECNYLQQKLCVFTTIVRLTRLEPLEPASATSKHYFIRCTSLMEHSRGWAGHGCMLLSSSGLGYLLAQVF
jgi:hypothetical protein